jgi:hypothetical protein
MFMTPSRPPKHWLYISWRHALNGRRAYVLLACLSLAVLLVQVIHPALHLHEVIAPGTDAHHACPLSHAAAALLVALVWLMGAGLSLDRPPDPLLWFGHSRFIHPLAPRPPPAHLQ